MSKISMFKPSAQVPLDFVTAYENFIGETETEFIESILYKLARDFYNTGYQMGRHDENLMNKTHITNNC